MTFDEFIKRIQGRVRVPRARRAGDPASLAVLGERLAGDEPSGPGRPAAGRLWRAAALTMAGIQRRSPSFGDHQPIPARHAKDHENLSPTLEWSGVPEEAVELAVLCEDPDAPAAPWSAPTSANARRRQPARSNGRVRRERAGVEGRAVFQRGRTMRCCTPLVLLVIPALLSTTGRGGRDGHQLRAS
jgi:Phosphatidylethanolamine-binding protein